MDRFLLGRLLLLAALGGWIWWGAWPVLEQPDFALQTGASATSIGWLLIGLPLVFWLGRPWQAHPSPAPERWPQLAAAVVLVAAGQVMGVVTVATSGWMLAAWALLAHRWHSQTLSWPRALCLAGLSFPWVAVDFYVVAWLFRTTAGDATRFFFEQTGFEVAGSGTLATVEGLPISIDAACAGFDLLQVLLLAGALFAVRLLPQGTIFVFGLLLLPGLAWLANTGRVIFITGWALSFGVEAAGGLFHELGGLLVLGVMLLVAIGLFTWMGRLSPKRPSL